MGEIIRGFELLSDWENSNISETVQAKKDGKKYFLKKYGEYRMPIHDLTKITQKNYDKQKANYESFRDNRIAINKALKEIAGSGGNIVLPEQWFEHDVFYIEATKFVPNVVEDEDVLKQPKDKILFIMLTAAAAYEYSQTEYRT